MIYSNDPLVYSELLQTKDNESIFLNSVTVPFSYSDDIFKYAILSSFDIIKKENFEVLVMAIPLEGQIRYICRMIGQVYHLSRLQNRKYNHYLINKTIEVVPSLFTEFITHEKRSP